MDHFQQDIFEHVICGMFPWNESDLNFTSLESLQNAPGVSSSDTAWTEGWAGMKMKHFRPKAKVETGQWNLIAHVPLDGLDTTVSAQLAPCTGSTSTHCLSHSDCPPPPPPAGRSWVAYGFGFCRPKFKKQSEKEKKGIFFSSLSHTITVIVVGEVLIQHGD